MNCNRCGKEMTKEISRGGDGRSDSWWCPFCGNTETMFFDKKKLSDEERKEPPQP